MLFGRKPRAVFKITIAWADLKDLPGIIDDLLPIINRAKNVDFEIVMPNA